MTDADSPSSPLTRLDATVSGRVQGVGFRYMVQQRALDLGLTGWVANASDGSLRCVAEGARTDLETLLELLKAGPDGAFVKRVTTSWAPASTRFKSFKIRSGGHSGD